MVSVFTTASDAARSLANQIEGHLATLRPYRLRTQHRELVQVHPSELYRDPAAGLKACNFGSIALGLTKKVGIH